MVWVRIIAAAGLARLVGLGRRLRALLVLAVMLPSSPASAQEPLQSLVDQLSAEGFVAFEVSRTLLGRVRLVATRPEGVREIVFHPATGEILRDDWDPAGSGEGAPLVLDRPDDGPSPPGDASSSGRADGGDRNRGHGNDADGEDNDNPGRGNGRSFH